MNGIPRKCWKNNVQVRNTYIHNYATYFDNNCDSKHTQTCHDVSENKHDWLNYLEPRVRGGSDSDPNAETACPAESAWDDEIGNIIISIGVQTKANVGYNAGGSRATNAPNNLVIYKDNGLQVDLIDSNFATVEFHETIVICNAEEGTCNITRSVQALSPGLLKSIEQRSPEAIAKDLPPLSIVISKVSKATSFDKIPTSDRSASSISLDEEPPRTSGLSKRDSSRLESVRTKSRTSSVGKLRRSTNLTRDSSVTADAAYETFEDPGGRRSTEKSAASRFSSKSTARSSSTPKRSSSLRKTTFSKKDSAFYRPANEEETEVSSITDNVSREQSYVSTGSEKSKRRSTVRGERKSTIATDRSGRSTLGRSEASERAGSRDTITSERTSLLSRISSGLSGKSKSTKSSIVDDAMSSRKSSARSSRVPSSRSVLSRTASSIEENESMAANEDGGARDGGSFVARTSLQRTGRKSTVKGSVQSAGGRKSTVDRTGRSTLSNLEAAGRGASRDSAARQRASTLSRKSTAPSVGTRSVKSSLVEDSSSRRSARSSRLPSSGRSTFSRTLSTNVDYNKDESSPADISRRTTRKSTRQESLSPELGRKSTADRTARSSTLSNLEGSRGGASRDSTARERASTVSRKSVRSKSVPKSFRSGTAEAADDASVRKSARSSRSPTKKSIFSRGQSNESLPATDDDVRREGSFASRTSQETSRRSTRQQSLSPELGRRSTADRSARSTLSNLRGSERTTSRDTSSQGRASSVSRKSTRSKSVPKSFKSTSTVKTMDDATSRKSGRSSRTPTSKGIFSRGQSNAEESETLATDDGVRRESSFISRIGQQLSRKSTVRESVAPEEGRKSTPMTRSGRPTVGIKVEATERAGSRGSALRDRLSTPSRRSTAQSVRTKSAKSSIAKSSRSSRVPSSRSIFSRTESNVEEDECLTATDDESCEPLSVSRGSQLSMRNSTMRESLSPEEGRRSTVDRSGRSTMNRLDAMERTPSRSTLDRQRASKRSRKSTRSRSTSRSTSRSMKSSVAEPIGDLSSGRSRRSTRVPTGESVYSRATSNLDENQSLPLDDDEMEEESYISRMSQRTTRQSTMRDSFLPEEGRRSTVDRSARSTVKTLEAMERTPSRSTMGRPSTPSRKSTWSRSGSRSRSMKSSVAEPVDDVTSRQSGTSSRLPTNETVYSRGKSDADDIERFSSLVTPKDSIATLAIVFSSASESKPMDDMSMSNESDIENLDSDEQLAREERRATSMRSKRDSGRSKSVRSKSRSSAKRTSSATSKTNYEISEDNDTIDAASRPEVSFLTSRSSKPYTQSISTPRTSLSTRQGSSSKRGSSFYTPTDDTILSRALSTAESDAIPTIVAPNDSVTTVTIVISSPTVSRSTRSDFGYLPSEERLISGQRRSTSARTKRDSARSESARTTTKSSVGKVMSDVSFNRASNYESLGDDDITESTKKAGVSFISPRTSSRYSELTTTTKPSSSSRQSSRSKPASSLYAPTNDSVFSRGQSNAEESEYLSEADDERYQPISHSRGSQQSMRKSTMQESLLAAEEERRSTVDRSGRSTVQTLEAMERTPSRTTMGQERASTPSRRSTRSRSTSRSIKSSMAEPVDDASNRQSRRSSRKSTGESVFSRGESNVEENESSPLDDDETRGQSYASRMSQRTTRESTRQGSLSPEVDRRSTADRSAGSTVNDLDARSSRKPSRSTIGQERASTPSRKSTRQQSLSPEAGRRSTADRSGRSTATDLDTTSGTSPPRSTIGQGRASTPSRKSTRQGSLSPEAGRRSAADRSGRSGGSTATDLDTTSALSRSTVGQGRASTPSRKSTRQQSSSPETGGRSTVGGSGRSTLTSLDATSRIPSRSTIGQERVSTAPSRKSTRQGSLSPEAGRKGTVDRSGRSTLNDLDARSRTPSRSTVGQDRASTPSRKSTRFASTSKTIKSGITEPGDDASIRESGRSSRTPTGASVHSRTRSSVEDYESSPLDDDQAREQSYASGMSQQTTRKSTMRDSLLSEEGRIRSTMDRSGRSSVSNLDHVERVSSHSLIDQERISAPSRQSARSRSMSRSIKSNIAEPTDDAPSYRTERSSRSPTDTSTYSKSQSNREEGIPSVAIPKDSVATLAVVISTPTMSKSLNVMQIATQSDLDQSASDDQLTLDQRRSTSIRSKRDSSRLESVRSKSSKSVGLVKSDVSFNRPSNYEILGDDDGANIARKTGVSFMSPRTSARYSESVATTKQSFGSRQSTPSKSASSFYAPTRESVLSGGRSNVTESERLSTVDGVTRVPSYISRESGQTMRDSTLQGSLAFEESGRSTTDRSGRSTLSHFDGAERVGSRGSMIDEERMSAAPSRRSTQVGTMSRGSKTSFTEPMDERSSSYQTGRSSRVPTTLSASSRGPSNVGGSERLSTMLDGESREPSYITRGSQQTERKSTIGAGYMDSEGMRRSRVDLTGGSTTPSTSVGVERVSSRSMIDQERMSTPSKRSTQAGSMSRSLKGSFAGATEEYSSFQSGRSSHLPTTASLSSRGQSNVTESERLSTVYGATRVPSYTSRDAEGTVRRSTITDYLPSEADGRSTTDRSGRSTLSHFDGAERVASRGSMIDEERMSAAPSRRSTQVGSMSRGSKTSFTEPMDERSSSHQTGRSSRVPTTASVSSRGPSNVGGSEWLSTTMDGETRQPSYVTRGSQQTERKSTIGAGYMEPEELRRSTADASGRSTLSYFDNVEGVPSRSMMEQERISAPSRRSTQTNPMSKSTRTTFAEPIEEYSSYQSARSSRLPTATSVSSRGQSNVEDNEWLSMTNDDGTREPSYIARGSQQTVRKSTISGFLEPEESRRSTIDRSGRSTLSHLDGAERVGSRSSMIDEERMSAAPSRRSTQVGTMSRGSKTSFTEPMDERSSSYQTGRSSRVPTTLSASSRGPSNVGGSERLSTMLDGESREPSYMTRDSQQTERQLTIGGYLEPEELQRSTVDLTGRSTMSNFVDMEQVPSRSMIDQERMSTPTRRSTHAGSMSKSLKDSFAGPTEEYTSFQSGRSSHLPTTATASVLSRGQSNVLESDWTPTVEEEFREPSYVSRGSERTVRKSTMSGYLEAEERRRSGTVDQSGRSTLSNLDAMERAASRSLIDQERISVPFRRLTDSRSISKSIKSSRPDAQIFQTVFLNELICISENIKNLINSGGNLCYCTPSPDDLVNRELGRSSSRTQDYRLPDTENDQLNFSNKRSMTIEGGSLMYDDFRDGELNIENGIEQNDDGRNFRSRDSKIRFSSAHSNIPDNRSASNISKRSSGNMRKKSSVGTFRSGRSNIQDRDNSLSLSSYKPNLESRASKSMSFL